MSGISLGLPRITSLLTSLRSPHLSTPIVHISGTNGKGSVSSYLCSILLASSLRVGRFNSPHLVDEWDCLQIGGQTIERGVYEKVKRDVSEVDRREEIGATSFELLAATAFEVFRRAEPPLELAIVEVGMGGATDATNVVDSKRTLLSIVTSIELDHQKFLGDTVREIARVKAGIVKQGGEVVLAMQGHSVVEDVLEEVANEMRATVYFAGEGTIVREDAGVDSTSPSPPLVSLPLSPFRQYPPSTFSSTHSPIPAHLPLPGSYQLANAAAATLAAQVLRTSPRILALVPSLSHITDATIRTGIEATTWPGRLDWIDLPLRSLNRTHRVLVDGAHNPSSATQLADYLASLPVHLQPTTLIIGLSAPRSPISILTPLLAGSPSIRNIVCVPFAKPESMEWIKPTSTKDIALAARSFGGVEVDEFGSVEEALEALGEGEKVVVAGSLYLAADVYRLLRRP